MSYARFGANDSNVYVYDSVNGGIVCCGCALTNEAGAIHTFDTSGKILAHLDKHRAKGDLVPDYTYEEIVEDYPNPDQVIGKDAN
jgi:hypothetical protein